MRRSSALRDPEDGEELLYIDDFDGLAALVQLGVVEIHIWGSTIDAIETPDQIVFDLDPDEGLDVEDVQGGHARCEGDGSTSSACRPSSRPRAARVFMSWCR